MWCRSGKPARSYRASDAHAPHDLSDRPSVWPPKRPETEASKSISSARSRSQPSFQRPDDLEIFVDARAIARCQPGVEVFRLSQHMIQQQRVLLRRIALRTGGPEQPLVDRPWVDLSCQRRGRAAPRNMAPIDPCVADITVDARCFRLDTEFQRWKGVWSPTLFAAIWSIEMPCILISTPSVLLIVVHVRMLDSLT